ncbi:MAG: hypothetical protein FWD08_00245 [Alphaproteobacteria bacterium]|nr:hypothetical protein [Alphaproteobacteria bacterium]
MNEVAIHQPRLPALAAGGLVRAIVPQNFEDAWRIATAVCKARMAPKGLEMPEQAMIAILHGLEVGLPPMMALQSISVINGRPCIWGDAVIGLCRGSGLLEWMDETFEGKVGSDAYMGVCTVLRRGEPKPIRRDFSVADAKTAGLWTKRGRDGQPTPWQTYPPRMLRMRARAFALRDGFADVLKGLSIREEVEDYPQVTREDPPAPPMRRVDPPSTPAEDLVFAQAPAEAVEWSDEGEQKVEQKPATEEPPAPPAKKSDPISTGKQPNPFDFPGDKPMEK